MKKVFIKTFLSSGVLAMMSCGTSVDQPTLIDGNHFGEFSYNGIYLNEYAAKTITVDEAKSLISIPTPIDTKYSVGNEDTVKAILNSYGSLDIQVNYYVSESGQKQGREDLYQGTDFYSLLSLNHYEPFAQMSVKYLYVDEYLIDYMEKENEEFHNSSANLISPFNDLNTYHSTKSGELVIQTHHFAELPASMNGGIGSTFRQDCEMVFDKEGKITLWQSSLGLYTSTPTGTVKQGYIFDSSFNWISK